MLRRTFCRRTAAVNVLVVADYMERDEGGEETVVAARGRTTVAASVDSLGSFGAAIPIRTWPRRCPTGSVRFGRYYLSADWARQYDGGGEFAAEYGETVASRIETETASAGTALRRRSSPPRR
jgi:hypothetical protein